MNFSFYIAKRYLFTKTKNKAINYITLVAGLGIIFGTAALFVVLSGFDGLKAFSLEFTSFTDPDLKVFPYQTKTIKLSSEHREKINKIEGIASFSEIVQDKVLLSCEDKYLALDLKGVDANYPQQTIDSILSYGAWMEPDFPHIVAGWGATNTLGFGIYDLTKTIRLYAPKPGTGQIMSVKGAFKSMKVVNVGIFQINESLNNSMAYTSIENARYLLGVKPNQISALEIITLPESDLDRITTELNSVFKEKIIIKNRVQLNDALYKMLNTEHVAVYLIFTLILIIALFNIIGSIVMMILHKKENLKTLYSIGADKNELQHIFFMQGIMMTVLGGFIGLFLGATLIILQKYFDLVMISPTLAYPVVLKSLNFVIAFGTILVLGVMASKIASWSIKKLNLSS
ncbi:MAG: ABC transporter permease [Flavobacteriaceae bacterium]